MITTSKRWRIWLGRIALALLAPLILVAGSEWICLKAGLGYPTSFLLPTEHHGTPSWTANSFFGYRFFEPLVARNPAPLQMERVKAPGVTRLFVLGESAAMGDPVIEFGLARVLDKLLNEPGEPRAYEIVNAAMTAINSHVIVDIAQEVAKHEADILLVYMGNNEVVGPYGPGTVFTDGHWGAWLTPLRVWLTRWRLAGVMQSIQRQFSRQSASKVWAGRCFQRNICPRTTNGSPPCTRPSSGI